MQKSCERGHTPHQIPGVGRANCPPALLHQMAPGSKRWVPAVPGLFLSAASLLPSDLLLFPNLLLWNFSYIQVSFERIYSEYLYTPHPDSTINILLYFLYYIPSPLSIIHLIFWMNSNKVADIHTLPLNISACISLTFYPGGPASPCSTDDLRTHTFEISN